MPFGFHDTQYIDLPSNLDPRYLAEFRTDAGIAFTDIVTEIDAALGAFNTTVDPLVASMITVTSEPYIDGMSRSPYQFLPRGEYTMPRPQIGEEAAHALPLIPYDMSTGFTEDRLNRMTLSSVTDIIEDMLAGARLTHLTTHLRRLFSNASVRIDARTAMTSPGFAGSGTGDNAFKPTTYPNGSPLGANYTHYFHTNAAGLEAAIDNAVTLLRRWHGPGPLDMIGNEAQIGAVAAKSKFTRAQGTLVQAGTGQAVAIVDSALYVGVYDGKVRVREPIMNIGGNAIAIYRSYGPLAPMNPLAYRYDPVEGRAATLRSRELYPLAQAVLRQSFGVGVNHRAGAVCISVAETGTTYQEPPII